MKKNIFIACASILLLWIAVSCSVSESVSAKSGAQLWGENCVRCHNAPPASQFNDNEWVAIGTHMQLVSHLTSDETKKIIDFLAASN